MSDLQKVLEIVAQNSVLDLATIDGKILPLSKHFEIIGTKAKEDHASYHNDLKRINLKFKFHYCSLCEKPHVDDGSWKGDDRCVCPLNEELHEPEITRRTRLRAVGDPRLDPSFPVLSAKRKVNSVTTFTNQFSLQTMYLIYNSNWLNRMIHLPLAACKVPLLLQRWNPTAYNCLFACVYVDILRKEFCSSAPHGNTLLDIVLHVLGNTSEETQAHYLELLDVQLASISFLQMMRHDSVNVDFMVALKNLGNSTGNFLTELEGSDENVFLPDYLIQYLLGSLPETFVWMPVYGGSPDDYVPPVNHLVTYRYVYAEEVD